MKSGLHKTTPAAQRTILVADDDEHVRGIVMTILDLDKYHVVEAHSGEHALELALTEHIDGFLLDIDMPGIGGIETCRQLRQLDEYKVAPILFVTGADEFTSVAEAFQAGCDDFISKPFNAVVFRARLKGHLDRMDYFLQLGRTRSELDRYLSRRTLDVVEAAARTGILQPPEEREMAICFTDIRGFTASSETMDPNRLFSLVSQLLEEQVNIVHEFGGYIDKFGGDGVMAVFDAADMAVQSCLCALRMLETARRRGSDSDENTWQFGVGIHSGRAVIGNIGSREHLDYSVIGNSVNLAARLCGQADPMSVVVSKQIRDAAKEDPRLRFHSERQVSIRGMKEPVIVYSLGPPEI